MIIIFYSGIYFLVSLDDERIAKKPLKYSNDHQSDSEMTAIEENGKSEEDDDNEQESVNNGNEGRSFEHEMDIGDENNCEDEESSYCDSFYSGRF